MAVVRGQSNKKDMCFESGSELLALECHTIQHSVIQKGHAPRVVLGKIILSECALFENIGARSTLLYFDLIIPRVSPSSLLPPTYFQTSRFLNLLDKPFHQWPT